MKMTKVQQEAAYLIAKSVRAGTISASQGAAQIHRDVGLNITSAGFWIYVYQHLVEGEEYKRALSAADSEYLLDRIGHDDGPGGLKAALEAFERHIRYRESQDVAQITNRQILERQTRRLRGMGLQHTRVIDLHVLNQQFAAEIQESLRDPAKARQKRLRTASKRPRTYVGEVRFIERNPDVVAEVLFQAKGVCGGCGQPAPFNRRSDGTPYLEVHHKTPLSEGGEDSVENAVALCPTCHRFSHFGPISGR